MDPNFWLSVAVAGLGAGVSWGVMKGELGAAHKAIEALAKRVEEMCQDNDNLRDDNTKLRERLTNAEADLRTSGRELDRAVARVEGAVTSLHRRLDLFLGARGPRQEAD